MSDRSAEMKGALSTAIYREIGARNFYGRMAEQIANEEGKRKFELLSSDEEGHRIKLESWFGRLFDEEFIAEPAAVEDSEIKDFTVDGQSSAMKALDIAIEAERKANEFYSARAEAAEDPGFKKLFEDLAEEELGHFNLLEAERNALIGGFYWFDMDSGYFLED